MTVFVSSRRTPGKPNTKHTPQTDWSIGTITILYIYYLQRVENASPYKWLKAGISVLQGGFHQAIEIGWVHHYRPKGAAAGVWKVKIWKIGQACTKDQTASCAAQ